MKFQSTILYILIFLFLANSGYSQEVVTMQNASKKLKKKFSKIQRFNNQTDATIKLEELDKILVKEPNFIDAKMEKAIVYYHQKRYDESILQIDESLSHDPNYNPKYYLIYANVCKAQKDIACEETKLKKYLSYQSLTSRQRKSAQSRLGRMEAYKQIINNTEPVELEMLSSSINSREYAEYKPVIAIHDTSIVFTRRINGQEDFYESTFTNNAWTEAKPINSLNTFGNEGAHTISADEKWMIFTRCEAKDQYPSCDLYISQRKNGEWTKEQFMGITNTRHWESQASFSPDGNTIYFASDRPGGKGKKDLYSVSRTRNKSTSKWAWQKPINLGDNLNTDGDDASPFMHPDGRTMYFMSDGHVGLGKQDLFVTNLKNDGSWSIPRNLGPSINTDQDEGGLFVDLRGAYAYFSKTERIGNNIESDIYRFELPKKFKPTPVTYITFQVKNQQTGNAISANLNIKNIEEDDEDEDVDEEEGVFIPKSGLTQIIPQNQILEITIEKEGYIFYSEHIDPNVRSNPANPVQYEIELIPIPEVTKQDTTEAISLRNIYFESGKKTLLSSSFPELDRLVSLLRKQKNTNILLNGHTDNVGNAEDNVILSRSRAEEVKNYLIIKQINPARISTQALGESQPLFTNETEEGRAQNRRIEFQIIYP